LTINFQEKTTNYILIRLD